MFPSLGKYFDFSAFTKNKKQSKTEDDEVGLIHVKMWLKVIVFYCKRMELESDFFFPKKMKISHICYDQE